jgi:thiamine biosynthesis protein ThiI
LRYNILLVRYGEIGVKGAFTRRRMHSLLANNIKKALELAGEPSARVRVGPGRIFVADVNDYLGAAQRVSRVFGVTSVSPSYHDSYHTLDELVEKAVRLVADDVRGRVFMVRARRSGEKGFTSKDVERVLGKKLLDAGGGKVDLENPHVVVGVEVRNGSFYIYTDIIRGPGGLPIGSEGRLIALVSGGFDSPVAAWMMMKRGAKIDILYYDIGDELHLEVVKKVATVLQCMWGYGYDMRLFIAPLKWFFPILREVPEGFRTIILKQAMYIGAEALAHRYKARALVTGESLAQVASQTLHNLIVTQKAISIPVFRPLIGFDKEEIIEKARKIGTHDLSRKAKEFCAIVSSRPSTAVDEEKIKKIIEEKKLRNIIKQKILEETKEIQLIEQCQRRQKGPVA